MSADLATNVDVSLRANCSRPDNLFQALQQQKKKNFTSFCQPTRLITCANYGNHSILAAVLEHKLQIQYSIRRLSCAQYDGLCLLTIGSVVVGYGRQLAELGTSKICIVDRECMVGMVHVGLLRPSWGMLTMRLLPGLEVRSHQQALACSRREASLSAGLLSAEAMMLSPAAAILSGTACFAAAVMVQIVAKQHCCK